MQNSQQQQDQAAAGFAAELRAFVADVFCDRALAVIKRSRSSAEIPSLRIAPIRNLPC